MAKKKFYTYWVSLLLIATGVFWGSYLGFVKTIWETDITMITSIISVLFIVSNILLGYVAYNIDSPTRNTKKLMKYAETCWFMSEQLMALGMLGTVIGLIHMLSANFGSNNLQDGNAIQGLLTTMWTSMGLALYTNVVGLATSIVLKLQVYFIAGDLEDETQEV